MKGINFESLGTGILIACLGIGYVIGSLGDKERNIECDKRGGVIQKASDEWFAHKACVVPRAKQ